MFKFSLLIFEMGTDQKRFDNNFFFLGVTKIKNKCDPGPQNQS